MSHLEVYRFEQADGSALTEWETSDPAEARDYGMKHKCRIVADIYEYDRSEVVEDFTSQEQRVGTTTTNDAAS